MGGNAPFSPQITKLRFFISLICNCEKDASKPNFGIPTLPNLETKFVAANSLIAKKRQTCHSLFENPEIEPTKQALTEIRHEHFAAKTANRKSTLRQKDKELREKLARLLAEDNDFAPADAKQLADWNPYDQNAVADFFDPEWMFGVSDGFDIIIGNPPYIQLQNDGGKLAKLYADCNYKTFARTGDIYCLFYERGHQLLKSNGHLCYITSNKWMRAGYGEKTRDFFAKNTNPMLLIDFAGVKIFESATVDTNILLFAKAANEHKTWCAVTNKQNKDSVKNLSVFVQQSGAECEFCSSDSWVILSPIEQSIKRKIEAVGTPLKDWDIQINYGIKTGYNDAFIIDTAKRDEILANCQSENERERTAELIRPILRGRDIKRYGYNWAGLYLIATFPSRHYDIEQYPAVKEYLLSFGIERLEQTGKEHNVNGEKIKARKKTSNKWFETQDSISYWEDFNKPKIVWGEISDRSKFAFEAYGSFIPEATTFLMVGSDLPYLLCVLNSPLSEWFFSKVGTTTGVGTVRWKKYTIQELLIPSVNVKLRQLFQQIVEKYVIGNITSEQLSKYSNKILYEVVGLIDEEIEFVENFYPPLI